LFILLVIYLSYYYVQPQAIFALAGESSLFYWLGVLSSVAVVVSFFKSSSTVAIYKTSVMIVFLFGVMIFSHVANGYFGGALNAFVRFLPSVVAYFLVVQCLVSPKMINAFLIVLVLLTTFLGYEAVLQSVTGFSDGGLPPIYEGMFDAESGSSGVFDPIPRARWFGSFNDPNDLGLALVVVVPLLLSWLCRKKMLSVVCLPIVVWGICLTNSRGAFISLFVSIATYFVVRFRSKKGLFVGGGVLVSLLALAPSRMSSVSDDSSMGRLDAWFAGLQMLKDHPLFGVGPGAFLDHHSLTAHNSYVLVLAELGTVGSYFYIGFFYFPLRWAIANIFIGTGCCKTEGCRDELGALLGGLVGVLTSMFFLSRVYVMVPYVVVGLISAFINVNCRKSNVVVTDVISSDYQVVNILLCVVSEIVLFSLITKFML